MKTTLFELVGLLLIAAGLIAINPALLAVLAGSAMVTFGYKTGGRE